MHAERRIEITLPPLVEYQHDALYPTRADGRPKRLAVIEGSPKCGKTYPCLVWLLHQALQHGQPGRAFWWVAPIYAQADIAYSRLKRMLQRADAEQRLWAPNDQKKTITLDSAGTIWFKSGDNPDSLYGEDVYALVVDEATRVGEETWHAVRTTTTATGGLMRIIGNVKGRKNWAYKLAREAEHGLNDDMHYARLTADMAVKCGLFPAEELESARKQLPESVFRELYYCEPSEDGANPFGLGHIAACVRPLSTKTPVAFGVDLARSIDYTVIVGLDDDGAVCYFDRWHGISWELTTSKIREVVGYTHCYADSSGVGDPVVERLARECPNVQPYPTGSRKQGLIEGLAVDIQQRRVMFPDGPIRSELESFEYSLSRTLRVQYSAPSGEHDDCVVALALASSMLQSRKASAPAASFVSFSGGPDKVSFVEKREDPDWGYA